MTYSYLFSTIIFILSGFDEITSKFFGFFVIFTSYVYSPGYTTFAQSILKTKSCFEIFDIVAKKGKKTKWVQSKSNEKPVLKPFKEFKEKYCSPYEEVEVWVWLDRKGKQVIKF